MNERWRKIVAAKELLGLGDQASLREIKSAYRRLAKQRHPDLTRPSETPNADMRELNAAYGILMEHCASYRLPLSPPANPAEALDPEEWWRERFGEDPLWGSKRK
ncbi:MAG: DnaJ domain-containing protein [Desulfobacteraceae bacterium]|nr:DnaJ domain-containing protein [Desulfobacteraceae bacterium]